MRLGDLRLRVLPDGEFRLDGGAMFGVVPRVLWQGFKEPDDQNRIRMTTNCLLVERGDELVLIDTGVGDKLDERAHQIFGLAEDEPRLPDRLAEAGFEPEDVSHVLLTHLHFDHCGWSTRRDGNGLVPTFPRARYWIHRDELEHARNPNVRDKTSYLPENWEPLFAADQVEVFDGEAEPIEGVRAVPAAGHSPGMCVVTLDGGGGERGIFLADLIPTAAHVPFPWIMAFDLEPMKTLELKQSWVPRLAREERLCVFEHDPEMPVGRIAEFEPGRFMAEKES